MWYLTELGQHSMVPVRWRDGQRLQTVPLPMARTALLSNVNASPDGRFFVGRTLVPGTGDEEQVVVDQAGHVVAQLDGQGTLYAWPADASTSLCVVHNASGLQGDVRLGQLDLETGHEIDFYTFPHDPDVGLHGIVGCSLSKRRVAVVELAPEGTTAAAIAIVSMDGQVILQRKLGSPGHDMRVVSSDDGTVYAENPVHQDEPAMLRDATTGAVLAELPGRRVRAFDGADADALTVDAQPEHAATEPLMTIQLVQISTGKVLWQATGYFRGSLTWEGHRTMAVGISDRPVPGRFGYRILTVGDAGSAHLVEQNGTFA